jgi:putative glutamine amidotransferase
MAIRIGVSYLQNEERGKTYLDALRAAGAEPVVLATAATCPQWPTADQAAALFDPANPAVRQLAELDGLLLTGGGDIDPMLYGEVIDGSGVPHWPRDHVETAQLHLARERQLPVFGICRGVQFLNVALGGSLIQDLPTAELHRDREWKGPRSHLVRIAGDSVLARIVADAPTEDLVVGVNSYHHQGVSPAGLAPGLIATTVSCAQSADAPDLVEAVESVGTRAGEEYVLGVQWHPERVGDQAPTGPNQPVPFREISARLFRAFVEAAEQNRLRHERRELVALEV